VIAVWGTSKKEASLPKIFGGASGEFRPTPWFVGRQVIVGGQVIGRFVLAGRGLIMLSFCGRYKAEAPAVARCGGSFSRCDMGAVPTAGRD
jgi:hypothetical protein